MWKPVTSSFITPPHSIMEQAVALLRDKPDQTVRIINQDATRKWELSLDEDAVAIDEFVWEEPLCSHPGVDPDGRCLQCGQ